MELHDHSAQGVFTADAVHRSMSPDAPMNLLLRFETASGPRTVIACSVPRQVAAEISHVMCTAGQHAEFIDRCSPLSIADRVLMREIDQVPNAPEDEIFDEGLAAVRRSA